MNGDRIEHLRGLAGPIENAAIDEWQTGAIDRRSFIRFARAVGMSAPLLAAMGCSRPVENGEERPGGVVRIGMPVPAGQINPITVADTGGVCMLSQTGEYLALSDHDLTLKPMLATSWRPNHDGSIWTFTIRTGVAFHDGRSLTAADVVATIDRLADPANGSIALSAFNGVLSKGGTRYVDDETVEFHLDAPNGSFPYLVSSDNFNAIILPADFRGDFEASFIGTGPFRLERYVPKARASFVRNDAYWGAKALPDRTVFLFYESIQAQVLAMQGGQLDVLLKVPVHGAQALLADPAFDVLALKSSAHEQLHMRTDMPPFTDKRVRRAIALCLDRDQLVTGMFRGKATPGNDHPFAPIYAATDPSVPQRRKDLRQARELMAAAGHADGFAVTLTTERFQEIPDYAVVVQNAVKAIGIGLSLNVEDQAAFYGRAAFGQSDWLDSAMGISDYAHRGVPNTYLTATLGSDGPFNAAHFRNRDYDRLVAGYIAALDPAAQRDSARQIQLLLLDETPVITAYFYDWLSVTTSRIKGVRPTAMSQLYLDRVSPK
ncbi:ABC transporter substrate-binding protein [Sphingomonas sanxanigenens]|nr:ABC transporter substrate-binding protein [Sphingomonas sanxanigenens]